VGLVWAVLVLQPGPMSMPPSALLCQWSLCQWALMELLSVPRACVWVPQRFWKKKQQIKLQRPQKRQKKRPLLTSLQSTALQQ
jgi:hypothetical protein